MKLGLYSREVMRGSAVIVDVLGGLDVGGDSPTSEDLKQQIREGLPFSVLETVTARFSLDLDEVASALDLPSPTLAQREKARRLRPADSDRLFRLVRVLAETVDVLGSEEKASRWLKAPNRALGGQTPLSLLDTDPGTQQVEEVLGRIEHGVFS
ncbi:MAG TPA: antitoxin Xre/MbcA/ParS toxin-binding domain-containing protein [Thermoanaerobaculia bacterium]|nr:antitoxin Xre/MbcA/ParS toxin-binding domain-containing protein [Thermoanaerobaculia bacterium]